jgi:hypothetical protein
MSGSRFGLTFPKQKPLTAAQRAEAFGSLRSSEVAAVFAHKSDEEEEEVPACHPSLQQLNLLGT